VSAGFMIPAANVKRAVAKKARKTLEDDLQIEVVDWLLMRELEGHLLYFHVPNGGRRHPAVAKKLKALGTRAGVPDLVVIPKTGPVCFIELKAAKGCVSDNQEAWILALPSFGCPVRVCRSLDEVQQFLYETGVIREVA
jgi:hypothetical protein